MKIRKVVIPVAGWGTRSLPASKNIPKEMLPVYNKPVIHYVVEEAIRAGIRDVVFVTSHSKNIIEDYFDRSEELEQLLARSGKNDLLEAVRNVSRLINVMSVRQKEQLGLGHAVFCAREMIGDEMFAAMVGDDFIVGENDGLQQIVRVAEERNMPVIGVVEVPASQISRYGIVTGKEIEPGVYSIAEMVEKPAVGSVDSRLAIVGRYVLTPDIFTHLEKGTRGYGGEIQLTDALNAVAHERGMLAVKMDGLRFDAGNWVDYLAAGIYMGLQDAALHDQLRERLLAILQENA